jgi:hypothetical protein
VAELKTRKTNRSVTAFVAAISDPRTRRDCHTLIKLMRASTGATPRMWGANIVGFGDYHYRYDSGREGDWFIMGFAPRTRNLTLYFMGGIPQHHALLARLGKHQTGKGCLYLKTLDDVDLDVLASLIRRSADPGRDAAGEAPNRSPGRRVERPGSP